MKGQHSQWVENGRRRANVPPIDLCPIGDSDGSAAPCRGAYFGGVTALRISTALLASSLIAVASPSTAAGLGEPFDSIQGMWYDMSHKVAVEVRGHELVIKELGTSNTTINKHGWVPGSVIAIYGSATQDREMFRFSGQCWDFGGNVLVDSCLDNATHFNRPGIKPFWALHAAGLTLWRRDHFSPSDWSSRD